MEPAFINNIPVVIKKRFIQMFAITIAHLQAWSCQLQMAADYKVSSLYK